MTEELTIREAAALVGVSAPFVELLIAEDKLRTRVMGATPLLDADDVIRFKAADDIERRRAADALTADAQALGGYD